MCDCELPMRNSSASWGTPSGSKLSLQGEGVGVGLLGLKVGLGLAVMVGGNAPVEDKPTVYW